MPAWGWDGDGAGDLFGNRSHGRSYDCPIRLHHHIELHSYGERFADPAEGRPASPPRLPKSEAPTIPKGGGIPGAPEPLPDTMTYVPAERRLHIAAGHIDNVPPEVWAYEVREWRGDV